MHAIDALKIVTENVFALKLLLTTVPYYPNMWISGCALQIRDNVNYGSFFTMTLANNLAG